jgi:hypothetical protein
VKSSRNWVSFYVNSSICWLNILRIALVALVLHSLETLVSLESDELSGGLAQAHFSPYFRTESYDSLS